MCFAHRFVKCVRGAQFSRESLRLDELDAVEVRIVPPPTKK